MAWHLIFAGWCIGASIQSILRALWQLLEALAGPAVSDCPAGFQFFAVLWLIAEAVLYAGAGSMLYNYPIGG